MTGAVDVQAATQTQTCRVAGCPNDAEWSRGAYAGLCRACAFKQKQLRAAPAAAPVAAAKPKSRVGKALSAAEIASIRDRYTELLPQWGGRSTGRIAREMGLSETAVRKYRPEGHADLPAGLDLAGQLDYCHTQLGRLVAEKQRRADAVRDAQERLDQAKKDLAAARLAMGEGDAEWARWVGALKAIR